MTSGEESNRPVLFPIDAGECSKNDVDIALVDSGRVLVASVFRGVKVVRSFSCL